MYKKRFLPIIVIIVLLIACVAFSVVLFGCAPWQKVGGIGAGISAGLGSSGGDQQGQDEDLPPPAVRNWELPVVLSITGTDSDLGLAAAWGFDNGVKTVNEQGGIRGLPATITIRDVAMSESRVVAEIGSFADSALVVIGPPAEALYKAGEQAFYSAGMPVIGAATDEANREAYKPYAISCIDEPGSAATSAVTAWISAERFKSVCVFYSPATSDRTDAASKAFNDAGKDIVRTIALGNEVFDAASVAERAFSSGADAYYIDLSGEDTLRIVKQLKFLAGDNASKLKILCGPLAADTSLLESAEGGEMLGVRVWSVVDPVRDAEKRKAFDAAYDNNFDDMEFYDIAVDYYQAALTLKQAFETLGLTGAHDELAAEREMLAEYLYNTGIISTYHGDLVLKSGSKLTAAKLYKITEKGFQ